MTGAMKHLAIRLLEKGDVAKISAAFRRLGWDKPRSQYEIYLAEQQEGIRNVFIAFVGRDFAGYVTVNWRPGYPPFQTDGVPEIQDFNVLRRFRRQGIGTRLMDEAERKVSERSSVVGIGVGVSPDYGAAQRLYVLRGYIPDGKGLMRHGRPVRRGDRITIDDGLVLYLTKALSSGRRHGERKA
ncbi:MAG TPA: GNAT family N-acetyltransferase [Rubrobacter sp.]|nr:GNAT family N-acetyltransferase [Rubrobacter sp.]